MFTIVICSSRRRAITGRRPSLTARTIHGHCGQSSTIYYGRRLLRVLTICLQTTFRRTLRRRSREYETLLPASHHHSLSHERHATAPLSSLSPVTVQEVIKLLGKLPAKHCSLDPVPTWLVKRLTEHIAPVICQLCNASLQSCSLPASQKHAVVQPRLKKATLNSDDVNSHRPISNLSFLSKFVERIVTVRGCGLSTTLRVTLCSRRSNLLIVKVTRPRL